VYLLGLKGSKAGQEIQIPQGRLSIGRDTGADIALNDPKVSRVHCYLIREGSQLTCIDNNSTNGTYLNNRRLKAETAYPVDPDDHLIVGGNELKLVIQTRHPTVQFASGQSMVTSVVKPETAAKRFESAFSSFRQTTLGERLTTGDLATERVPDAGRMQRMMRSLECLYKMSKRISSLMPLEQLYQEMKLLLFDIFDQAENLVFLLWDEEAGEYQPKLVANALSDSQAPVLIPHAVFHRALKERVTLVANNAASDIRFSQSESVVGLSIKSIMCAPLVLGERVLGVFYVDNRQQSGNYSENDAELLAVFATQAAIAIDNARLLYTVQKSYQQTLLALVTAIEAKDEYTRGHSQRVAQYAVAIAGELQLPPERIEMLRVAAELHDIGKIGTKDMIIQKTERLSDTEFQQIKHHVVTGEKIVSPITYLAPVLPAIRNHHERWDGKGYPDGLIGEKIAIEARIICVADAFDAMTTKRTYNVPMPYSEAIEKLRAASGTQFDPHVVDAFCRYMQRQSEMLDSIPESSMPDSSPGLPSPS